MTTTKKYDPEAVKAVIDALEKFIADPNGVNMVRYSNLAVPFLLGQNVKGFSITPRREGLDTPATVVGGDKALAYLRSLL